VRVPAIIMLELQAVDERRISLMASYQRLLQDIDRTRFELVVSDALDPLCRDATYGTSEKYGLGEIRSAL
jgi:hypothetical protein